MNKDLKGIVKELVVHIGVHKSGTTSIQEFVSRLNSTEHVEFYSGKAARELRDAVDQIALSPFLEDSLLKRCRSLLANRLFISSESLCGVREDLYKGAYLEYVPATLKKICPDKTSILITVRKPSKIIASMYVDSVLYGHTLQFDEWLATTKSRGWDTLWRYDRIYNAYKEYFSYVRVVDFDELLSDNASALYDIVNATKLMPNEHQTQDVKSLLSTNNVSPTLLGVRIQREFINRFCETKLTKWQHIGGRKDLFFYTLMRYGINRALKQLKVSQDATRHYQIRYEQKYSAECQFYTDKYMDLIRYGIS